MARNSLFWHVPTWAGNPAAGNISHSNSGNDVVIDLLETETASQSLAPDNYYVERIVGQFDIVANIQPVSDTWTIRHRIYEMPATTLGVDIRDLWDIDDADTSFLADWCQIMGVANDTSSRWWTLISGLGQENMMPPTSRLGAFDVRVGRKINSGNALIWHAQVKTTAGTAPPNLSWGLNMWCRVLCKQLG